MKKIISIVLSVLMLLMALSACGGQENVNSPEAGGLETPLSDGKTLKLLAIGNSFSNNMTQYLYDIAMAQGATEVIIGRLWIAGCSLQTHVETIQSGAADYGYDKNDSGEWVYREGATFLDGLLDEDWDIITMQQSSSKSGDAQTYDGYLDQLVSYVNEHKTNPDAKLVWQMTWAYEGSCEKEAFAKYDSDQMTMYTKIVEAVQEKVLPTGAFAAIIPAGTAVQNARTSYFGDRLTTDTLHMNDLGMVIGGYTWYAVFTGKPLEAMNLEQAGALTFSESNKEVILEAVNAAVKDPFTVTQSAYTE